MDDFPRGRCYIILGRYILTLLGFKKKSKNNIDSGYIPLKVSTAPIIDLCTYKLKGLNSGVNIS